MASRVGAYSLRSLLGAALIASTPGALAAGWEFAPRVTVGGTASDNATLSDTDKQSDWTTELSPGIRVKGSGGRLTLNFDYSLRALNYARHSKGNDVQHALNAFGTLEAWEKWLYVDASGVITRQAISAFGGTSSNTSIDTNSTETASYRVAPYIRGNVGSLAEYRLRYERMATRSKSDQVSDIDSGNWSGNLKGLSQLASLGWALDANHQSTSYENGRHSVADRLRGSLIYQTSPQIKISLFGGREANDYASINKEYWTTWGAGAEWSPSPRTQLAVSRERRFFGDANSVSFTHRTALTSWKLSSSKDVTILPNQLNTVSLGSYYDLYFNLYQTIEPDPVKRAALVENFLRLNNIPTNGTVLGGFLTSNVTLEQRHDASFAILGSRNTIVLTATQSRQSALQTGVGVPDDFSKTQNIRQRGLGLNWAYRLSPLSSVTASFSKVNSKGLSDPALETTQDIMQLIFTTQLSPKTRASISARHTATDGSTAYSENAVTGFLSHEF
ncbi:porin family protein [Chitinimonas naiadis]